MEQKNQKSQNNKSNLEPNLNIFNNQSFRNTYINKYIILSNIII